MSEQAVETGEIRALARAFDQMVKIARQGLDVDGPLTVTAAEAKGIADGIEMTANAFRLLSVVKRADEVEIVLPTRTAYSAPALPAGLRVSPDTENLTGEDAIEHARRRAG